MLYNVQIWDHESESWVFPTGMKNRPWRVKIHGVRRVLRELQSIGYEGHRGDPSVFVSRVEFK